MDGFETAALVRDREKSRDTPIIFLTAAIKGEAYVARGYALNAVDYIFKPFEPEILRSKVAVFVQLFRKTQEVRRQAEQLAENALFLNSVLDGSTEYAIVAVDLEDASSPGTRARAGCTATAPADRGQAAPVGGVPARRAGAAHCRSSSIVRARPAKPRASST